MVFFMLALLGATAVIVASTQDDEPARFGDSVAAYARGTDNHLWQRSWRPSGWLAWTPLGGPVGGDPHALSDGSTLHLFARGTNTKLQYRSYTTGRGWTPFINLDGALQG